MIIITTNAFLVSQLNNDRMSLRSIQTVTDHWRDKDRPQVIEFQFDQLTQRDLILHNLKSFRFYGKFAEDHQALNKVLYSWKVIAKEMAVRTFCFPDSVIKNHLAVVSSVLDIVGAPIPTVNAFSELQQQVLKTILAEEKKRDEHKSIIYGQERIWNPPSGNGGRVENDDRSIYTGLTATKQVNAVEIAQHPPQRARTRPSRGVIVPSSPADGPHASSKSPWGVDTGRPF
jgi:hypothetical protein